MCYLGDASSRLLVAVASPEVTRSREIASHLCALLLCQCCAQLPLVWLQGFFYIAESFRVQIMFDFKPSSDDPGDLVESSDDLGASLVPDADSDDSDVDDDDGDSDDEDVADIGEEAGKAEEIEENPFFAGSDDSDSDVSDVSDDDDDEDEAAGGSKEPVDEEDELIKALKAAREKKVRNCPPDIKTQV